ncbi:MAG: hypothetical protein FH762_08810 [Firmicutes bacterium]|nr:hypothetical protein [Bacillota bacterium]
MDVLTSIDLLEKDKGYYKNTALSSKYLRRDSELFVGDYLRTYSSTSSFDDINIIQLVKEGPNNDCEKEGLEAHEMYGDYTEMLKTCQRVGRASEIAAIVSSLPEFARFKKMLDLGGGPGLIGMAIIKKHPNLKGVIFEVPNVAKVAEDSIKEYNLED